MNWIEHSYVKIKCFIVKNIIFNVIVNKIFIYKPDGLFMYTYLKDIGWDDKFYTSPNCTTKSVFDCLKPHTGVRMKYEVHSSWLIEYVDRLIDRLL